jgi:small acid-soluble spore protein F (minor alpha/beta-type SASP)
MSKNNSILPESDKMEIAKELGVYDKVKSNGWGEVSSKDCGNIVKKALEKQDREENNK